MSPRSQSSRAVTRAFENKLRIEFRHSAHKTGWYYLEGVRLFRVSLPQGQRWSRAVQENVRKVTRLGRDEYDALISCSMSGTDYAVRARNLFSDKID